MARRAEHGGYHDILIIVDQLDRIPQKQLNDHGLTNHEDLFLNGSRVLRSLQCDVLYTVPIELAYSHCNGRLQDVYGFEVLSLPMIDVRDEQGLELLRRILARRVEKAGGQLEHVFAGPNLLDQVCKLSGGHPRSLFSLLRAALDRTEALPLTEPVVDRTVKMQASDFRKSLSDEEWKDLLRVHDTHKPLRESPADRDRWMTFLRERYVYAYYDPDGDGLWYDWNPLLAEARR